MFCGEKPVGVNKVDAVSVACDPDCLCHELVLVLLLDVILYQGLVIWFGAKLLMGFFLTADARR